MTSKTFAVILSDWMEKSNVSLRSLAKKSGVDSSYLSKVINGKRNPPSDEETITKIAGIIGYSPDELMFACGRIPSKLQNIFLRGDIKNILRKLALAEKTPPAGLVPRTVEKSKYFRKTEIPDEIL